jgi:hypothetical protein
MISAIPPFPSPGLGGRQMSLLSAKGSRIESADSTTLCVAETHEVGARDGYESGV